MDTNQAPKKPGPQSEEIDLGQLFKMIGRGFERLGRAFLRLFLYIKSKFVILAVLVVVGLVLGFVLNQFVPKKMKTEVIVKPNMESKNYLYDVVEEIRANMKARDTAFFKKIGIDVVGIEGFEVTIETVEDKNGGKNLDNELKYLELLQKFQNDDLVADVVRSEIMNKSSLVHRITFFYKNASRGNDIARKLMEYINSNDYYTELMKISRENATERIEQNNNLVLQIDKLVANYSEKLASRDESAQGRILVGPEEQLDIPGLLTLKNALIRDIESKKLEMQGQPEAIRIINFGRTQVVQKQFLNKSLLMVPILFVLAFFLVSFLVFLNRKAIELRKNS